MGRNYRTASKPLCTCRSNQSRSSNCIRQLEEMAVIQDYDNPQEAWSGYKELHKLHPSRELYVFHTSRKDVEVVEEFFSGVRQQL